MVKRKLKALIDLEVNFPDGYELDDFSRDTEYNAKNIFLPGEVKNIQIVDTGDLRTVDMSRANPCKYAVIEYRDDSDSEWHDLSFRKVNEKETDGSSLDGLCKFCSTFGLNRVDYRGRYAWVILESAEGRDVYRGGRKYGTIVDGKIQRIDKNE